MAFRLNHVTPSGFSLRHLRLITLWAAVHFLPLLLPTGHCSLITAPLLSVCNPPVTSL